MSGRPLLPFPLALLLCSLSAAATAQGFRIEEVRTRYEGDLLVMDARVDYAFSEEALEALDNGVPLTLEVHIQVRGVDDWVWSPSVLDLRQRSLIRYRPLSERYLVSRLPDDGGVSYVTRDAAVTALGEIDGLQLLSKQRLAEADGPLEIQVKAALDVEELPLPLKPIAYLFPSWKLSTGWTKWPLVP